MFGKLAGLALRYQKSNAAAGGVAEVRLLLAREGGREMGGVLRQKVLLLFCLLAWVFVERRGVWKSGVVCCLCAFVFSGFCVEICVFCACFFVLKTTNQRKICTAPSLHVDGFVVFRLCLALARVTLDLLMCTVCVIVVVVVLFLI